MSSSYHTDIASGAAANASIFNAPLGTLDAAIGALNTTIGKLGGGASPTNNVLIGWTEGELYELTAVTWDTDGVPTTATVKWPDGSTGTFTTTNKNTTWLAIDAYTITHADSGKTVTQAAVTRDANGNITIKPALTVA